MYVSIKSVVRNDKPVKLNGKYPIYYRVRIGKYQMRIPAKFDISPSNWNSSEGKVKDGSKNGVMINNLLDKKINEFEKYVAMSFLAEKKITRETVKNFFNGRKNDCFYSFYERQVKIWEGELAKSTINKYFETLRVLKDYQKKLTFDDVNLDFIEGFHKYLVRVRKNKNGCSNRHKNLKTIIRIALKKDYMKKNPYDYFKIKTEQTERVFLIPEEVRKVESIELKDKQKNFEKVIDMFLFACYTGLRYSDIQNLNWKHVVKSTLIMKMTKTKKEIIIPLMQKANNIIEKYSAVQGVNQNDFVFPRISNQKINKRLKDVVEMTSIDKNISFHSSRHTFATSLIAGGVSILDVRDLLGHSDLRESQIYAKTTYESLEKSIGKLEKLLV